MSRRLPAVVLAMAATACGAAANDQHPTPAPIADFLRTIVLSETEPPAGTTFFREQRGAASATQLVQDDGPEVQVSVQRGLVDAITREFGTPGIIAMVLEGAPTESLDPTRDVWVASAALAYADAASARAALLVLVEETGERLERRRDVTFEEGGAAFRGRFLRGMTIVTYVWGNGRLVLHLMVVGALQPPETRVIARGMAERAMLGS